LQKSIVIILIANKIANIAESIVFVRSAQVQYFQRYWHFVCD